MLLMLKAILWVLVCYTYKAKAMNTITLQTTNKLMQTHEKISWKY
jgi:hypothetical protein